MLLDIDVLIMKLEMKNVLKMMEKKMNMEMDVDVLIMKIEIYLIINL
jgi:hypothetical protein